MDISNLSDAEFKTLVIWMLKELSEDLNSIKKIQSETKETLIEMKNNRETTVEWMKLIMIWNIRKQKTTNWKTRRKKNPKKQGQCKQPVGQL